MDKGEGVRGVPWTPWGYEKITSSAICITLGEMLQLQCTTNCTIKHNAQMPS